MEAFSALLALCEGNPPATNGPPPPPWPVPRSFDVSFDLRLNRRLSKQSIRWWFWWSCSSWHHCNDIHECSIHKTVPCVEMVYEGSVMQSSDVYLSNSKMILSSFLYVVTRMAPGNGPKIRGAVSIRKTVLPGMATPMLKIRRPNGRLIFNMEIAIRR